MLRNVLLRLKQRLVNWLLRDVHVRELHVGEHSITLGTDLKINGSAGASGQFLKTQGAGASPAWVDNPGDISAIALGE